MRGSEQGESHGGVFLVDMEHESVRQVLDWNTMDIDWQGRGWDRGLRGITCVDETVYIAASDELFAYTPDFKLLGSWRNPYLKHCHELDNWEGNVFITSTGYDSILAFDVKKQSFHWGMHVDLQNFQFDGSVFDPNGEDGPLMLNKLHLNNVVCRDGGMYISGTKSGGMLHFNGKAINMSVTLPAGNHNAQPFRDGVLFNDTENNSICYTGRGDGEEDRMLAVPRYELEELTHRKMDDSRIARQGFARGLCPLGNRVVAGGSSPSTITLYDLKESRQLMSVRLTTDIRNAIHGLEAWPF